MIQPVKLEYAFGLRLAPGQDPEVQRAHDEGDPVILWTEARPDKDNPGQYIWFAAQQVDDSAREQLDELFLTTEGRPFPYGERGYDALVVFPDGTSEKLTK